MATGEDKYFNFPVSLLKGFLIDSKGVLSNILSYSLYAQTQNYEYGDEVELIQRAARFFCITVNHEQEIYDSGEELFENTPTNFPMVGIRLSIFWDYYKNEKSDFEKVCLLGFLAVKSILQNKAYCRITNSFWLARMDGKSKSFKVSQRARKVDQILEEIQKEISPELRKYCTRYYLSKIKDELELNWGLIRNAQGKRGFYVSFKIEDREDLEYLIEKNSRQQKLKLLKEGKKEARAKAQQRIEQEFSTYQSRN